MKQAVLVLVAMAACADEPDTSVVDRGQGCAYATSRSQPAGAYDKWAFLAGEPVQIRMFTRASSPCVTELQASCHVHRRGNELVVTSRASWNEPVGECNTRRGPPAAESFCESPPLEAGTYVVRLGTAKGAFAIPNDPALIPCFYAD
jgi:hypothetical protein